MTEAEIAAIERRPVVLWQSPHVFVSPTERDALCAAARKVAELVADNMALAQNADYAIRERDEARAEIELLREVENWARENYTAPSSVFAALDRLRAGKGK